MAELFLWYNTLMEHSPEDWMNRAAKVATEALCHRSKCGAVIVSGDEVIGSGYNAPPLDKEENRRCDMEFDRNRKPKYDLTCCLHAEWRAMMDALKNHPSKLPGSRLYFTRVDDTGKVLRSGEPYCTECSRFALDLGIATFALWHEDGIVEYPTKEYNDLSYQYHQ